MLRKRTAVFILTILACLMPAEAQDWAKQTLEKSPRHGEWVTIKHGNRSLQAFVVYPEVKTKAPAVLVIHEIFGLTDWARTIADQLAAEGYIAIAPDLLSGHGPKGGGTADYANIDDSRKAVGELDPNAVTADLNAAADYVKKLPAANGKLFVAGFCWGGSQSFRFATNRHDLNAAFVFYGIAPNNVRAIKTPVYGFYAGNDARVDATIPDTTTAMQKASKKYEPVTYDGAGHGFMRTGQDPSTTSEADKKARTEAWKRWLALLKANS